MEELQLESTDSDMVDLFFNNPEDDFLQIAVRAINKEFFKEKPLSLEAYYHISCIYIIEISLYRTLRELIKYLVRVKRFTPASSVLVIVANASVIPSLKCSVVSKSAPLAEWKKSLLTLSQSSPNIDRVMEECAALLNLDHLSAKQRKVVECLGYGMNVEQIASHLFLSAKTVYTYILYASEKLGFSNSKRFHCYILNEFKESTSPLESNSPRILPGEYVVW
ncbi:helix-turn-helix transcriptional regulator [Yokenella regensburgei]|uniref:helix-turn-helix transcriptional regulator n=1 Tax=Yokenella regensburgei TaxID=158877 RepID=UPI001432D9C6|nr:LuxR C-terminal-related transcriptional regulator [Yokenella regensburgei]QIU88419.1 helix-turn-helix transcriptional regulator [Yokenella regensburgei]